MRNFVEKVKTIKSTVSKVTLLVFVLLQGFYYIL